MARSVNLDSRHKSTFIDVRWSQSQQSFIAKVVTESRNLDKAKYPKWPILDVVGGSNARIASVQALANALGKHLRDGNIPADKVALLRAARSEHANG